MAANTGNKNFLPSKPSIGRKLTITHGPMTEATATLDGQHIGSFVCPPGRRYAVRQAMFLIGTRATTGSTYLHVEKVPIGTSAGSGTNLNNDVDASGVRVDDDAGGLGAANSWVNYPIDDTDATGVNILAPGDRMYIETSGTLTALASVYAVVQLEEIAPLAGT